MTKVRLGAYLAGALAPALLAIASPASAGPLDFAPTAQITLPNQNIISFDISFVDPIIGLYFLADRTNKSMVVIDTATNTLKVQIHANPPFAGVVPPGNDHSGPDGDLTVNHRELWVGDAPSTVKVIDLFSTLTTHVISTGGVNRTDEMCVDPRDHVVLAANNAEDPFPFVTFISTTSYSVVDRITMDGTVNGGSVNPTPKATNGVEQCQWNPRTGKFYITVPEVNGPGDNSVAGAVVVLDPVTHKLENTFTIPVFNCAGPQGMAIGPAPQILLGCNAASGDGLHSTVIIDENTGAIIKTINNQSGADEVWFSDGDGLYFLARSAAFGATQKLGIIDSVSFAANSVFTANKNLPRNAHSVAADPVKNQVYVPIPAGVSTICGPLGGNDAQGCIAVFTASAP